jgi:cytochrome d ubiquinol oxidase subunit II
MLETTWFLLWGVLWTVYFILDGFDLGLGTLMPFLAEDDRDRRIIYNSMGPFWDGNEVWLVAAGGVTFAAFPKAYAVMFSGLYTPLMLLLFALIVRGVSFEFRGLEDNALWRRVWDGCMTVGSFVPALLFGVAFANIFMGLPIDQNGVVQGNILSLLNPYGLAGGILFVLLFTMHGALWLTIKSEGGLQQRAAAMALRIWPVLLSMLLIFVVMTALFTDLLTNYWANPLWFAVLLIPVGGLFAARALTRAGNWWGAWSASALTIGGTSMFGLLGIFPALLPSSINPAYSVTIHNGSSSTLTLQIMLGVALTFVPIILMYQIWMYRQFRHKVTDVELGYDEAY